MSALSGGLSSGLALPPPVPPAASRCQQLCPCMQHRCRLRHAHRAAALSEAAASAQGAAASPPRRAAGPPAVAGSGPAPPPAWLTHRPGWPPRERSRLHAAAAQAAAEAEDPGAAAHTSQPAHAQQGRQQQGRQQQQHADGTGTAAGIPQQQPGPADVQHPQLQAHSGQLAAADLGNQVGEEDEAKELNRAICAAQSHTNLLELVASHVPTFSRVNAVTAFHRLAKHCTALPAGQRAAVRKHPVAAALTSRLESFAGELDDLQAAQVLWAHAQLRHGSNALLDRLYSRLDRAVVPALAGGGASAPSVPAGAGRRWQRRAAPPLRLQSLNAVVMLCYAQAKLGRPVRHLLAQLADALLAAPDQPAGGTASDNRTGLPAASLSDGLGALSGRSLCLLLWSMASMGALPPALLLRGTRELRRRGLADLSVQSMCLVITAQELCLQPASAAPPAAGSTAAAAAVAATSGSNAAGSLVGCGGQDQPSEQRQAASSPSGSGAAAVPGFWDQDFMDDVAAELADRSRRRSGFWLNSQDCCTLARGCALAWQACLGWGSGGGSSGVLETPLENRLMLREEMQRHTRSSPHRRALAQLLTTVARAQAPRLNTRALTSLVWSFTFLLRPGLDAPLLDALAQRAAELGRQQLLDAQAVASLAWSYSTLKYDHPQLYECLAQEVLRMLGRDGGSGTDSEAGSSSSSSSSDSAAGGSSSSSSSNFVDGGSVVGHSNGSDASGADTQRRADSWRPGHAGAQAGGSAFVPQTVSVLLFAFAAANRLDSPAQRKMMGVLAELADSLLLKFTPQGLANLAWGLTVAGIYPPQLIRRWRAVAGAERRFFRPAELNQLHLVEVALRLEAPPGAVQGPLPADAASFFDSLYQAGRLRAFAGRAWARHQEAAQPVVTDFQQQVYRTICALGVPCQLEHSAAGEYSIDVAIPEHRIAVEADGPVHFSCNTRHPTGSTALKRRLLQRLGWRPVDVPFYDWWGLPANKQMDYMRRKLQEAGLQLPASPLEAGSRGVQRQRRPQHAMPAQQARQRPRQQQGQQQRRRIEQPGQAAFADQLEGQLEARKPAVQLPGAAAEHQGHQEQAVAKAVAEQAQQQAQQAQQQQQQVQQQEEAPVGAAAGEQQAPEPEAAGGQGQEQQSGSDVGGQAGAAAEPDKPLGSSTLAQRAQRLSVLQYQRGKLSKQGLVTRRGLQAAAGGPKSGGAGGSGDAEDTLGTGPQK
ncbi:hypothetical protein ABPG77_009227 [Micractinium sp. CCAP 211/92]